MWQTHCYQHAWKQNLDGDKNKPKITLAWVKENFPILRDLLGPIEPEISIFFLKSLKVLYNSDFNTHSAFFQQINMALNDHSHKMWPQIRILSSMKCWDLGMGCLCFYFIILSIKYMLVLTQNCAHVWISLTFVGLENLVLDQQIIPKLIFFFLITYLVNITLILWGEIASFNFLSVW